MPLAGVLFVRLRERPALEELSRWRQGLLQEIDPEDLGYDGPLHLEEDEGMVPVADGSVWLDVGLRQSFYGIGYERGDPCETIRLAEWLERAIPGGEVWYGADSNYDSIRPFGAPERAALLEYFGRVGHEPYESQFRL